METLKGTRLRWATMYASAGRNDLPALAIEGIVMKTLPPSDWAVAVADAWTLAEWPSRVVEGRLEMWEYVFDMAAQPGCILGDEGKQVNRESLPETMTLWRGCYPEYQAGMSWTTDRATAAWFAGRMDHHGMKGHLYQVTVPNYLVLGQFNSRQEAEVVLAVSELFEDDIQEVPLDVE